MKNKYLQIISSLDIEAFKQYYIKHNIKDTAKKFNISVDRVTQICKDIGFKKDIKTINAQIQRTKLEHFRSKETLNRLSNEKQKKTLISKYGSLKEAQRHKIKKYKITHSQNTSSFAYKIKNINKEEFIDLYLNKNKPRTYMMKKYNLSSYMCDQVIDYFNCHKPRTQSSSLAIECKILEAGGKDNYFNYLNSKVKATKIKHYGSWEAAKTITSINCKKAWELKPQSEIDDILKRTKETNKKKYGVQYCYQLPQCRLKGNNSKPNLHFAQVLDNNKISYSREFALDNYSYDFKVDKTLIEINPSATHNSTYGIYDNPPIDKNYHKHKSMVASQNGYNCIHVWDWDDISKIVNNLYSSNILYARKCEIHEIDKDQIDEFLNLYHFQNTCKNQEIRLGLFFDNELVQVMSFGKARYNKNYQYELLRLCTKFNYKIVGGAQKLFKYFLDKYNPKSIISYCDKSKFNGNIYGELGFSLISEGKPAKHWFNTRSKKHILDSSLLMKGFDILLGKEYGCFGKGTCNEELMRKFGFVEIFDCGQASYKYINKSEREE